jgi:protein tyrosine phosphatase (PTP) superfamily phosphohydrolase (DUF442 family)
MSLGWFRPLTCLFGGIQALASGFANQLGYCILGGNFAPVVPRRAYRSGQLSAARLREVMRAHSIRTVINLRGWHPTDAWHCQECQACEEANVTHVDVYFRGARLPWVHEVRQLVDVFDNCEYPILIHCQNGIHRSGFASALFLLVQADAGLAQARDQLSPRFGYLAWGDKSFPQRFLDEYARWLTVQRRAHSRGAFLRWLEHEYSGGAS